MNIQFDNNDLGKNGQSPDAALAIVEQITAGRSGRCPRHQCDRPLTDTGHGGKDPISLGACGNLGLK